uniref:ABC transporter n=1 Tax=Flintiella sanguinaria TaxID=101926 RepID=A0A1X9PUF3_9RHOD|nr:ABC transporter [Flintiella sanguinaria]
MTKISTLYQKNNYRNLLIPQIKLYYVNSLITIYKNLSIEVYGLTERLFIQVVRRSSTLIAGTIQPLLWLFLFGALFEKLPINALKSDINYGDFLNSGVIIFTAFSSALNAGLSIVFDREFGFLNRLLVYPLTSRLSILISSLIFVNIISLFQSICLICVTSIKNNQIINLKNLLFVILIVLFITIIVSLISLTLAFILPGHIELLAFILITNLPVLFCSTALAPLDFMPIWLKIIASSNPLTYAIEALRLIILDQDWFLGSYLFNSYFGNIKLINALFLLIKLDLLSILMTFLFFIYKYK